MSFHEPSKEDVRKLFTDAPFFEWPTFDHMPLNCFDLTSAIITFPGDISESRARENSGYADYKFDISDLNTCPKKDELFEIELWNEESINVPWFLGRFHWACMIDAGGLVVRQGFFGLGVAVARFQNIEGVDDLTDLDQLKHALFHAIKSQVENGAFQPIQESAIFTKVINGRPWLIARSLDQLNHPTYRLASPIDHQTVIFIPATLDNSWFMDETIPEEVEQKHLASFWDFLAHINVSYSREGDVEVGSIIREAPGQAEKMDDLPEW